MAWYEKWYSRAALVLLLWGFIACFGPSLIIRHSPPLTGHSKLALLFLSASRFLSISLSRLSDMAARGQEYLVFTTSYGDITVRLFAREAPQAVNFLKLLVEKGLFEGCAFYRAEPAGETFDTGYAGSRKGYALLQGGLHSCGKQVAETLPIEAKIANRNGTVSLITGTSEFFFNLEDHHEWNGSFTAWGEVADEESWRVLNTLVSLPTRQEKHPSGTVLRILLDKVVFSVLLRKA